MLLEIGCQAILKKRNKNKKMYHIKDDKRSIRSSEMLYDGLAKLIREKPFNSIKVKNLVEVANVGRTTFYRNFDDIEDILKMRCDQVFDGLIAYLTEYARKRGNESRTFLLKPLLRYFYLHSDIIELLMSANRLDILQSSFRRVIEPFKIQLSQLLDLEEEYTDYSFTIRIGVATNILIHWIETGKKQAPDELADTLGAMIENMVTLDQLL
jgi:AcrR family transcriptional regulator